MKQLAEEYFERDLSEAEEQALEEQLCHDEAIAQRLFEGAARCYAMCGLPDPMSLRAKPQKPGRWGLGWSLALAASLGLAFGLLTPLMRPNPAAFAPAAVQWQSSVLPKSAADDSAHWGFAHHAKVPPVPVMLTNHQAEVAVLKVVSNQGQLLKVLWAGRLEPGEHRFEWDRRDLQGGLVAGADWRVLVEEGLPAPGAGH